MLAVLTCFTANSCADMTHADDAQSVQDGRVTGPSARAAVPFELGRWAVPISGTIPFSADVQNIISARHHDLLIKFAPTGKDDSQPRLYAIKAKDLEPLRAGLEAQSLDHQWVRVAIGPTSAVKPPPGLADPLEGSWAMLWRTRDGRLVLVAGVDADRANAAGEVPLLVDVAG